MEERRRKEEELEVERRRGEEEEEENKTDQESVPKPRRVRDRRKSRGKLRTMGRQEGEEGEQHEDDRVKTTQVKKPVLRKSRVEHSSYCTKLF